MLGERTHRIVYIVLLMLLGGCMVTSTYASNLVWVLLSVNWLIEGRWKEKWRMARESRLLHAYLAIYLLLVAGLQWTDNLTFGMMVLQVKLPLLVVPLIILTTRPLEGKARSSVLLFYAATVLVVSIISAVRLLTIPDLPYRKAVPYISHIRFALNCCMVVYLAVGYITKGGMRGPQWQKIVAAAVAAWMLAFVLMIRSYTAIAILAVVSIAMILLYRRRWQLIALWVLLTGGAALMVVHEARSYYDMSDLALAPRPELTAAGRPYHHAQDGIIENGNYINDYVCTEELRNEWTRRSRLPYDTLTERGYSVESTLIRYLNAVGLTKDSVGMAAMSDAQIADVEHGMSNPIEERGNPIKRMVYVMLFEREYYVHTHAVSGFTMLQRLELWDATLSVIGHNLWVGVGTGDVDDELHSQLAATHSELQGTTKRTHNQYLSLLAALGIIGMAIIVAMLLRASPALKRQSPLLVAWLLTILISCITEDTLDTLAGILFCIYFLAFRSNNPTDTTDEHR